MKTFKILSTDLRTQLADVISAVESGAVVEIVRYNRVVARLSPASEQPTPEPWTSRNQKRAKPVLGLVRGGKGKQP